MRFIENTYRYARMEKITTRLRDVYFYLTLIFKNSHTGLRFSGDNTVLIEYLNTRKSINRNA